MKELTEYEMSEMYGGSLAAVARWIIAIGTALFAAPSAGGAESGNAGLDPSLGMTDLPTGDAQNTA